ncbi:MAG: heme A synthase [Streptosporangiales bacterium]|nr:heme A synthase [Streptosporangiales bacterium]
MRRSALAAVVANIAIAVSGAVVRVTSSGLGCPNWPRCTGESLVPVRNAEHPALNMAIEFGNRLFGVAVFVAIVLCLLVAVRMRPRRRTLVVLAALLPAGWVLQAVIGGLSVWYALSPGWITAHFLGSVVMITIAVALHVRSQEGDAVPVRTVGSWPRRIAYLLVADVVCVLVAGTVVTGSGPHAGDASSPRYPFRLDQVAHVHAAFGYVLVALTVTLLVLLHRRGSDRVMRTRTLQLAAVVLAQGVIGYVQYFTGVPSALVVLHVLGACVLWAAVLRVRFATRTRAAVPLP